jgi:peptidoglycan/xylan/chitin deacetylase (PgdA/CDA1 family)
MNLNPFSAVRNEVIRKRRAFRRRRVPHTLVLMYHRIAPTQGDRLGLAISPENFAQHLEVLTRVAQVAPLSALDDAPQPRHGERPRVAITFDDGYVDNLLHAEPVLARFKAPATVFIATSLIGGHAFWWDDLAAIILGNHPLPAKLRVRIGVENFESDSRGTRQRLFATLQQKLKAVDHEAQIAAISSLREATSGPIEVDPIARPMTQDELLRLSESKFVAIGAHTLTHPSLPNLSPADQLAEIAGSKQACERMLGFTPDSFAYPYGDLASETPDLVAKAGFARACSTRPDLNFTGTSPLLIPRFGCGNWDGAGFERHLRREWLP